MRPSTTTTPFKCRALERSPLVGFWWRSSLCASFSFRLRYCSPLESSVDVSPPSPSLCRSASACVRVSAVNLLHFAVATPLSLPRISFLRLTSPEPAMPSQGIALVRDLRRSTEEEQGVDADTAVVYCCVPTLISVVTFDEPSPLLACGMYFNFRSTVVQRATAP